MTIFVIFLIKDEFKRPVKAGPFLKMKLFSRFDGPRDGGSCIYYLLKSDKYVSFHLPLFDEIFLWHAGGPAKVLM